MREACGFGNISTEATTTGIPQLPTVLLAISSASAFRKYLNNQSKNDIECFVYFFGKKISVVYAEPSEVTSKICPPLATQGLKV